MKTKCMSCGGTTKKMQNGGVTRPIPGPKKHVSRENIISRAMTNRLKSPNLPPLDSKYTKKRGTAKDKSKFPEGIHKPTMQTGGAMKKMQKGGLTTSAKKVLKQVPIKTIKTIKKVVKKITKPTTPKMELGGSLETFQNGGGKKGRGWRIGMDPLLHEKQRCNYKKKKKLSQLNAKDKAVRILKGVGKTVLGAGAAIGAGAIAYKKSPRFKNALDQFKTDVKDKLGLQKGGVVKKYQDGGPIDSLKVIKKKGKLAVKTEKQKQAAAKKAAANAKKIAKAKENARLNLEWQKMTKDQKDSLFINERQKNW